MDDEPAKRSADPRDEASQDHGDDRRPADPRGEAPRDKDDNRRPVDPRDQAPQGKGDDQPRIELDDDDDDEDLDDLDDDDEEHDEVTVEIRGLSLYTHHGVTEAEREIGQRLVVDLRMAVVDCDAVVTDRVADTIDYGEVCQLVALVAQQRSYQTLERLCAAIADRIVSDYDAEEVWVKCAKPEPPIPLPVEEVSVELWRAGSDD